MSGYGDLIASNLRATGLISKHLVTCNVYYVKPDAMLEMFMSLVRH